MRSVSSVSRPSQPRARRSSSARGGAPSWVQRSRSQDARMGSSPTSGMIRVTKTRGRRGPLVRPRADDPASGSLEGRPRREHLAEREPDVRRPLGEAAHVPRIPELAVGDEHLDLVARLRQAQPARRCGCHRASRPRTRRAPRRPRPPRRRSARSGRRRGSPGPAGSAGRGCRAGTGRPARRNSRRPIVGRGLVAGTIEVEQLNQSLPWHSNPPNWATQQNLDFLPFVGGALMALSRRAYEAIGGFTEVAPLCEDVEISWRLQLRGYTIYHAPAVVTHVRYRETWQTMWRQTVMFAEAHVYLYQRFAAPGMPRSSIRVAWQRYKWLAKRVPRLRRMEPKARYQWLHQAAACWGRLKGSLRYRVLYL